MARNTPAEQDIEQDIQRIEVAMRQLKIQYDMFFAGALPRQPFELRSQIATIIRRYERVAIRKYAHRFHFNSLVSKFNAMCELWSRTLRSTEEGDRRNRFVAEHPTIKEKLVTRCSVENPSDQHEDIRRLHTRLCETKQRVGDDTPTPSFDKFLSGISSQTRKLRDRSGCDQIELRLTVRGDQVRLKARPSR